MYRSIVVALLGLLLPQVSYAAPPKDLYGKSVIITWTETREQRPLGEQAWRQVSGTETLKIYVSEAGRVFVVHSYTTPGGTAETPGQVVGLGKRKVDFNGRSLLILEPWGNGGATRITTDFDAGFGSCSTQVTRGKENPTTITRVYSGIIKRVNETRSAQVGGASCSIRGGNVFGN